MEMVPHEPIQLVIVVFEDGDRNKILTSSKLQIEMAHDRKKRGIIPLHVHSKGSTLAPFHMHIYQ